LVGDRERTRVRLGTRLRLALRRLEAVDYSKEYARLTALNRLDEDAWESHDAEVAVRLANQLTSYSTSLEVANECWLALTALQALSRDESPLALNRRLAHFSWPVRADATARLLWIREQEAMTARGVPFTAPFECRVSDRNVAGRGLDKEHYQLICYLHGLVLHTGERLIPIDKGETPDFTLMDEAGSQSIGVEMAEAPASQAWADEQDVAAIVIDALSGWLASANRDILIDEPCSWELWRDDLTTLEQAVRDALALAPGGDRFPVVCAHLNFKAELTPGEGTGLVMRHNLDGQGWSDRAQATQKMADGIIESIKKKLVKKNGLPRAKPSVRPCDLVLYPNTDDWPDWDEVFRLAVGQMPTGWSTYFDRIWLSSENRFGQLA
jgi:hypothetical protein